MEETVVSVVLTIVGDPIRAQVTGEVVDETGRPVVGLRSLWRPCNPNRPSSPWCRLWWPERGSAARSVFAVSNRERTGSRLPTRTISRLLNR